MTEQPDGKVGAANDLEGRSPTLDAMLRDDGAWEGAVDSMFAELEKQIAADERRPGRRLREAPTGVRRALAFGAFAVIAGLVGLTMVRPDLALYSPLRLALELASFAVLLLTCLFVALRPAYVPTLPRTRVLALVAASLAAGLIVAMLPPAHPVPAALVRFTGDDRWFWNSPCLYIGLLFGLPVYFVGRLLDRDTPLSSTLAATAAGLAGTFVLQLHCPDTSVAHRVSSHATVTFVFLACYWVAYRFHRILRRR